MYSYIITLGVAINVHHEQFIDKKTINLLTNIIPCLNQLKCHAVNTPNINVKRGHLGVDVTHEKQPTEVFSRKALLKNFAIFTEKHRCLGLFLTKVQAFKACKFIKKRLQRECFSANIAKFSRTPIVKNICKRLLLTYKYLHNSFLHMLRQKYLSYTCFV